MKNIKIGNLKVNLEELKSRGELLEYFQENGPTHAALMDFCEDYRDKYGNELCWAYPISDGKHLGTFLLLVREGILSIPYHEANKVDYEVFCIEDIRMFLDYADMEIFIDDWKVFHEDLIMSLSAMKSYLYEQEVKAGEA